MTESESPAASGHAAHEAGLGRICMDCAEPWPGSIICDGCMSVRLGEAAIAGQSESDAFASLLADAQKLYPGADLDQSRRPRRDGKLTKRQQKALEHPKKPTYTSWD